MRKLWAVEWLTLAYMAFTTLLIAIYWNNLNDPWGMLLTRGVMLGVMTMMFGITALKPNRLTRMLRVFPQMFALIWWYPENYDFCSQYPYLDHIFANADQWLFGYQPALEFSKKVSSTFWSEAMCLGYYAYYYMMLAVVVFYMLFRYKQADRACFIFLASFFAHYIIFEFLPVAGPQYYFQAIGIDATAPFPAIGDYFRTHTECLQLEDRGIFSRLVISAHETGERPTAAFPSSHVGMITITMILAWATRNKWLFWGLTPLFLLLCVSTVYIKAHYAVDAFAGLIFAFPCYWLIDTLYTRIFYPWNPCSDRICVLSNG